MAEVMIICTKCRKLLVATTATGQAIAAELAIIE